ncbi:ribonuclease Z [Pseudonocardia sp. CNS-139]|nr:ribonuclease Z [Pseudonocardia sp. CNS-139]
MAARELVVLGTASQAPTRHRNHNCYLLRWDAEGFLFDPGEGTQRQMLLAGVPSSAITRICVTPFLPAPPAPHAPPASVPLNHGDHCLGVPGVLQRISLDRVAHPVHAHYPASGSHWFKRLRYASAYREVADVREAPVERDGPVADTRAGVLEARRLDHPVESFGYRLVEPDGRRMLPDLLGRHGVRGADVGRLQAAGELAVGGRTVRLDDVSVPRPGQRFAFVMDTRLCDGVYALAAGVDMLVIESTFLAADEALAREYGHLTARQAGEVAAACGVRLLVLAHFSQRYPEPQRFADDAAAVFGGEIVVAADLTRVPVPARAR